MEEKQERQNNMFFSVVNSDQALRGQT